MIYFILFNIYKTREDKKITKKPKKKRRIECCGAHMYDEVVNEFHMFTSILCFPIHVWVPMVDNL